MKVILQSLYPSLHLLHYFMHMCKTGSNLSTLCVASFPGHSQILPHSYGEKNFFFLHRSQIDFISQLWSGLGTRLVNVLYPPHKLQRWARGTRTAAA